MRFAVAVDLIFPVILPAQESKPWEKIPIPPLHEFKPQEPKRIELKNGIVLFLQEDHELPFITGSVLDSRRLAGRERGEGRHG